MATPDHRQPFVVDGWLVDPLASRIRKGDRVHRLEPRLRQVLVLLADRAGEVVTRAELEDTVWAGTVVGYDAVTNAVNRLRKLLDDDPRRPHIIETISKTGYCLIAEVQAPPGGSTAAQPMMADRDAHDPIRTAARPSLVVLPFDDLSGDPGQLHVAQGLTEDLITDLSRVSGLLVASRSTAQAYGHETPDARGIGRALGVGYVLEGSVRATQERVRITARLVDATNAFQLWSEKFDLSPDDLLALTDRITDRIVTALRVKLSERERRLVETPSTRDGIAYDRFLRGKSAYWRWTLPDNASARMHYREAIERDPAFALAWAQLARAHFQKWVLESSAHAEDLDRSLEFAQRAVHADKGLAQAHSELGWAHLWRGEHAPAIVALQHAIELDPNYADGIARLCEALTFDGRPAEGLEYMHRARCRVWYEPFYYRFWAGEAHYYLDQLEESLDELRDAVRTNPDFFPVTRFLAAVLAELGHVDEARQQVRRAQAVHPQLSRSMLARQLPFRYRRDLERQLEALRIAGLPE